MDVNSFNEILKPCPFCGEKAKILTNDRGVCVRCTNPLCSCGTGYHVDMIENSNTWRKDSASAVDYAIRKWNRRSYV